MKTTRKKKNNRKESEKRRHDERQESPTERDKKEENKNIGMKEGRKEGKMNKKRTETAKAYILYQVRTFDEIQQQWLTVSSRRKKVPSTSKLDRIDWGHVAYQVLRKGGGSRWVALSNVCLQLVCLN